MIPTFNCANYLRRTLASLMEQPSGTLELAQIVVVDDCSTRDDPVEVIREVAPDRAVFHRHSRNLGPCATFNSCLDLAERAWVQILHGDDYMLPGAYREFSLCLEQFPDALAIFGRSQIVTSADEPVCESDPLGPDQRGRLPYDPRMWARNLIYPGGVLLNRRAVDLVGKFDCTFSHVNDWNYWWRLARTGECVYTRACIAGYRVLEEGHSSSLIRTGRNVAEGIAQVDRLIASIAEDRSSVKIVSHLLYEGVYETAFSQCARFVGDNESFMANWRWFRRMPRQMRWRRRRALTQLWWRHVWKVIRRRLSLERSDHR